jgi:hypothetical protein
MWKLSKSGSLVAILLLCIGIVNAADWPQLGNGPQRKNYSSETMVGPFNVRWSKSLTDIDVRHRVYHSVQVISGDGKVYAGTKSGIMFAFDALTGNIAWQYQADGPILHTAGYAGGKVFFGTMNGSIYALNTGGATPGSKAWQFNVDTAYGRRFGFSCAMLLADSKVFAVDRGGYLYALNQSDGSQAWGAPYNAQAPVLGTPSYNNSKIYFGSEAMKVHAVNSSNGSEAWVSGLVPGQSFIDVWPVITNGEVILRPFTGIEPHNGTTDIPPDKWNPPIIGMYGLSETNGAMNAQIAHYQVLAMSGACMPPAVAADGRLAVPWKLAAAEWSTHGWALVNLTTTRDAVETCDGNLGAPDEIMASSIFNNQLLVIHCYGTYHGNPVNQNGVYNLITHAWTWQGTTAFQRPADYEAYAMVNNQSEGATAISGANGLLYHHAYDMIYCLETE